LTQNSISLLIQALDQKWNKLFDQFRSSELCWMRAKNSNGMVHPLTGKWTYVPCKTGTVVGDKFKERIKVTSPLELRTCVPTKEPGEDAFWRTKEVAMGEVKKDKVVKSSELQKNDRQPKLVLNSYIK
jgi:hypothetical protein